jgi:hypothetical protein
MKRPITNLTELRLNNFVTASSSLHFEEDDYIKLVTINQFEGCYYTSIDDNEEIESLGGLGWVPSHLIYSIPLTEEWLEKFGFNKPGHSWNGDIFHLSEWDDYPLNWFVALNKNGAMLVEKLKYVHQLQNLYFSITGEELKLIP